MGCSYVYKGWYNIPIGLCKYSVVVGEGLGGVQSNNCAKHNKNIVVIGL